MSLRSKDEIARLLARSPLLSGLTDEERLELAADVRVDSHQPGERLVRKGDPGHTMMIVAEGRVKITAVSPRGADMLLNVIDPGEIFGELAIFDGKERSADAVVAEPSIILSLGARVFREFVLRHPDVGLRVMAVLADKVRQATSLVEAAVFLQFPARLALYIERLKREYGTATELGVMVRHGLSQQEIADSIGVTRESVSKQMSVWRERGLMRVGRGWVLLLGRDGELEG